MSKKVKVKVKVAHTRLTSVGFPQPIPVLGSQHAGNMSHKPGGRLPLFSARPAVILATLKRALPTLLLGEEGVNSLPKTVTRHRHDCDLNPGPSAPESSTLTTRLPSHPCRWPENRNSENAGSLVRRHFAEGDDAIGDREFSTVARLVRRNATEHAAFWWLLAFLSNCGTAPSSHKHTHSEWYYTQPCQQ